MRVGTDVISAEILGNGAGRQAIGALPTCTKSSVVNYQITYPYRFL